MCFWTVVAPGSCVWLTIAMMVTTKHANRSERVSPNPPAADGAPFEMLRRSFIVGRPSVVAHTVVSAVSAAQSELTRLEAAIAAAGMRCQCQVGLVVSTTAKEGAGRFGVSHSAHHAAQLITKIAALKEPKMLGLVYAIVDPKTLEFEFWTKAFFKGRETEKLLDLWVADGVNRMLEKCRGASSETRADS
jgi:hypothetical protein